MSNDLAALRGDDGALSTELVETAIGQITKDHPHCAQPVPNFDGGARPNGGLQQSESFGDRLKAIASGR